MFINRRLIIGLDAIFPKLVCRVNAIPKIPACLFIEFDSKNQMVKKKNQMVIQMSLKTRNKVGRTTWDDFRISLSYSNKEVVKKKKKSTNNQGSVKIEK